MVHQIIKQLLDYSLDKNAIDHLDNFLKLDNRLKLEI